MPLIDADAVLDPPTNRVLPDEKVRVVCDFGMHKVVAKMPFASLARMLDVSMLKRAPEACKWAICVGRVSKIRRVVPVDSSFTVKALRRSGLTMLYDTAGKYYSEKDAVSELDRLPARRGNKTTVVTEFVVPGSEDEDEDEVDDAQSEDTEYDSDDQPKPKKPKPPPSKRKKRKRKATRKPHPDNAEFRASVVRAQAEEAEMNTFTLSDVGKELSFVFAQLLKAYVAKGTFEGAKVFLYDERPWLNNLRRQARACGNKSVAALANRELKKARGEGS